MSVEKRVCCVAEELEVCSLWPAVIYLRGCSFLFHYYLANIKNDQMVKSIENQESSRKCLVCISSKFI